MSAAAAGSEHLRCDAGRPAIRPDHPPRTSAPDIRPGHPLEMASARRFAPSGNATTREPVETRRVEEAGPGGVRRGPGGVRADAGRFADCLAVAPGLNLKPDQNRR